MEFQPLTADRTTGLVTEGLWSKGKEKEIHSKEVSTQFSNFQDKGPRDFYRGRGHWVDV